MACPLVLPESCCGDVEKLSDDDLDSVDEFMTCFLDLMESNLFEDNRYGIERLIKLANSELVNSKKMGLIVQALICRDAGGRHTEQFWATFLTYICTTNEKAGDFLDGLLHSVTLTAVGQVPNLAASCHSDIGGSFGGCTVTLKVPTIRVLVSSLE
jgi:hypothetical protein